MQQQHHPPGRRVGNVIYYGTYHGREVQCKKCLLVTFTVLLLLIGFIVTIVGHTLKPFWSESHTSFCGVCEEDNRATRRNAANCRIVGPIFIAFGFLLMIFTIYFFKKKRAEGTTSSGSSYAAPPAPASTTLTYNQTGQSVNVPYPGTGQPPYPQTQPQYPPQSYPTEPQPYPSAPPYPMANQPYPTGPQQYPPTQQPYPGAASNQGDMPPPPSYNDALGGGEKH